MTDQTVPAPHPSRVAELFNHSPVKRLAELRSRRPPQTTDEHVGVNGKIALIITGVVGTMWCAYAFALLALLVLPQAVSSPLLLVQWISQTFIQLVMLSILMVGQNIQGRAADKRAIETYKDAEAILEQCVQLQQHLMAQDKILDDVLAHLHQEAAATS
jgi:hypothetical protein